MVRKVRSAVVYTAMALALVLLGFASQELLIKPTPVPKNTVTGNPPAWKTDNSLALNGYATVLPNRYVAWDVSIKSALVRHKVSIELLNDGSYLVYWPVDGGAKTAYVHLVAGFSGLGALVNEVLYGDPDSMIAPKALENQ